MPSNGFSPFTARQWKFSIGPNTLIYQIFKYIFNTNQNGLLLFKQILTLNFIEHACIRIWF